MLQVASVVGDSVPIGILHAIYPIEATEESLERDLNFLEQAAFVRRSDRPGYFQFCQVILVSFICRLSSTGSLTGHASIAETHHEL